MTDATPDPTSEAWEAYHQATTRYLTMQREETPSVELFKQAMVVNKLQREFAALYDTLGDPKPGLRLIGGTDAPR
ncbi:MULTISPECIES: hypothetical protein [unclassified Sphingomonas]|uniref:hypothetical protein n=1 Tax=unclassified Sphingomonas TaxID=196159 RepID=UPI0007022535|nr:MULTISPECIES: hypothetical protein [unclassified Sphingomonas]KQX18120.1 hypothetical protein ASD17_20835 [Sphingomonas sp. Root1294]KQY72675.1 hypothetical protein ASD39_17950 [Sphingomonas sp. Root50]KRB87697.1 hypothetical protein ASE22_23620 [Sphingomonas sp. Root720]